MRIDLITGGFRFGAILCTLLGVAAVMVAARSGLAQPGTWRAYPAFTEGRAITSTEKTLWVAARVGVFAYRPETGEFERYTTISGLHDGEIRTLQADPAAGRVWVGFADGVVQGLEEETGEMTTIFDIARAEQYSERGVNRIRVRGDELLIATDFGLVIYDTAEGRVRTSVARVADFRSATVANDILAAPLPDGRPGLWLATDAGLARAPAEAPNLQLPSIWEQDEAFAGPSFSLTLFDGTVFAGGGPSDAQDVYSREKDGTWRRRFFMNVPVTELFTHESALYGVSAFDVRRLTLDDEPQARFVNQEAVLLSGGTVGPEGDIWAIDGALGAFRLPEGATGQGPGSPIRFEVNVVTPSGPYTNSITDLAVGPNGELWVVTQRVAGSAGISRFQEAAWTTYRLENESLDVPKGVSMLSATVGADGTFYGGSFGDGLVIIPPGEEPRHIDRDNSTLRGAFTEEDFVVVPSITLGEDGRRWVANRDAPSSLHLWNADGTWTAIDLPAGLPASTSVEAVVFDEFGQLWMAMGEDGLGVYAPGTDPRSLSDDQGRSFGVAGGAGQGLPDGEVNAVARDGEGRIWAGTTRGVAYVFSPGSAFSGDATLAQPQWPIREGGETYLLRDVNVLDMETDPAGRLWIATTTGAYLLNREGTEEALHLTAEKTPLPSDNILAVDVDPSNGRVYFAVEGGLFSYDGDATGPAPETRDLRIAPSPFRPGRQAGGVLVSGLVRETSVRILTPDGQVVHRREVTGGSFRWDGRDDRTGELVTSGVYIVAAAGTNGEGTAYGKIAVLR